ncbi:MAG: Gfo/Idh/MocA family oxidoreductase [Acidobacteriota bacterium]
MNWQGICDLYTGRLENAKRKIRQRPLHDAKLQRPLDKKDVDAVLICTHDVWHARITLDALAKGKARVLRKPMLTKSPRSYPVMAGEKSGRCSGWQPTG